MEERINRKELYPGLWIGDYKLIGRVRYSAKETATTRKKWRVECRHGKRETIPEYYFVRLHAPKRNCDCEYVQPIRSRFKEEYGIWCMMRVRCTDKRHRFFKHYGGRGITVCKEWMDQETGFERFLEFMGPRPSPGHSIDRVDVDGNYEPYHPITKEKQVRWATSKEQAANTRAKKSLLTSVRDVDM